MRNNSVDTKASQYDPENLLYLILLKTLYETIKSN